MEEKKKNNPGDFREKYWLPWLWPVCTLLAICLILSVLLALVNNLTVPIIAANEQRAADETRMRLLPEADGFSAMAEGDQLPAGIRSAYSANNGAGYVIEASSTGYGGDVPVLVAFSADGTIVGVEFSENNETPGLGQKIYSDKSFAAQFVGHANTNIATNEISKIASATITTSAGILAVNTAIDYLNSTVLGQANVQLSPMQRVARLMDGAIMAAPVELAKEDISEAWFGDNGNYVITATAPGFYDDKLLTATVGMTEDGEITGVWLDTSADTDGLGSEVGKNQAFLDSFTGQRSTADIAAVAGATVTSKGVFTAVDAALAALPEAQATPAEDFLLLPSLPVTKEEHQSMAQEDVLAWLLPGQTLRSLDVPGTTAWKGSHDGYIITGTSPGFYENTTTYVLVALDEAGRIVNLWLDTSADTEGLGREVQYNAAFISAFYGLSQADIGGVDAVAGATVTSGHVEQAILEAYTFFEQVKGAG